MLHKRRRAVPVGALSAILVLSSLFTPAGGSPASGAGPRPPAPALAPGLTPALARPAATLAAPAAGVLRNADPVAAPATSGQIRVAAGAVNVRYDFDAGVGRPITDPTGRFRLRPLGQNGGTLRLVPQNGGLAVDYPDRCTLPRERDCPRAILEGYRDDNLNPGRSRMPIK